MNKYLKEGLKANYDKYPVVQVPGYEDACICGWTDILQHLSEQKSKVLVLECYQGVRDEEVLAAIKENFPAA